MKLAVALENRLIRLGLLTAGLLLAAWAWKMTLEGPVATLRDVQVERARTAAIVQAPKATLPDLLPRQDRLVSRNEAAAAAQMQAMLVRIAGAEGLLVERMSTEPAAPGHSTRIRMSVSGNEAAVLRFVGTVEGGRPLIRFVSWRLEPAGTARALRFAGLAAAHWSPAR